MNEREGGTAPAKVVVAEDSRTIRGFLCRHVRACLPDAVLAECEHGAQAIECVREGDADLVITDLQMPQLGGEDFLLEAHARGHLARAAVIVISSAITPKVREALRLLPRVRFLRKPATGDEILGAIRQLLAGSLEAGV